MNVPCIIILAFLLWRLRIERRRGLKIRLRQSALLRAQQLKYALEHQRAGHRESQDMLDELMYILETSHLSLSDVGLHSWDELYRIAYASQRRFHLLEVIRASMYKRAVSTHSHSVSPFDPGEQARDVQAILVVLELQKKHIVQSRLKYEDLREFIRERSPTALDRMPKYKRKLVKIQLPQIP